MEKDTLFDTRGAGRVQFRFDDTVARVFPDMINRSVPGYAASLDGISLIAHQVVRPGGRVYDLGCTLGAALLAAAEVGDVEAADDARLRRAAKVKSGKAAGWYAAGFNALMMVVLAALYLRHAVPVVAFFDADPVVVELATAYIGTVVFTYVAFGVMIVLSQAMTGAGATLQSLLVDAAVLGFLVVPAAYVIVQVAELPRHWLWVVIAFGNVAGMLAYGVYYQRGSFLSKDL